MLDGPLVWLIMAILSTNAFYLGILHASLIAKGMLEWMETVL